jgi:hypothetical protein
LFEDRLTLIETILLRRTKCGQAPTKVASGIDDNGLCMLFKILFYKEKNKKLLSGTPLASG